MSHKHATLEDTVYFWFGANDTAGSGDDGAAAVFDVRLAGAAAAAAPVFSGAATLLSDAGYTDGAYEIAVPATTANGFAADTEFAVFCTLLVDSQNPTGFVGSCRLTPLAEQAALTALDGKVDQVLTNLLQYVQLMVRQDSAIATDNAAALAAINADGGSGAGAFSNAADALEALRDRGDAAWLTGAGGSSPTVEQIRAEMDANSTQLAAIVNDTGTALPTTLAAILLDTGTTLDSKVDQVLTNLLQYVQLMVRQDSAIATDNAAALAAINADGGSGAGAFSNAADALEALRDRGDAAWLTGAGGSSPTVEQIRAEMDANSTQLAAIVNDTGTALPTTLAAILLDTGTTLNDKLDALVTGVTLSAASVDAILDEAVEGTVTVRQILMLIGAIAAGKSSGHENGLPVYRNLLDTLDRISGTTDANNNRTAVTTNLT